MASMLISDSLATSAWMVARACTANTAGPAICRWAAGTPAAARAAANCTRKTSSAWACASVSEPRAAVCASSTARSPSRDDQTPARLAGWAPASSPKSRPISSPVGSCGSSRLTSRPAGEDRRSMLSAIAARRPATEKRSGVTAGLSR
ncbi:MAG: hypothetical protein CAPSK01_001061 [Candidatus Accumulibacter vicinus]|uniref:Uncharacterized protein n=1 Tax=Candidatus Accumulibacter vicinus TaxID=2954382 RepID=A0A084Y3M1_9PROT|nr:MAG: hypothetical protein CAPSK01_001061 [Candidatus Accumulibacter vicinus]